MFDSFYQLNSSSVRSFALLSDSPSAPKQLSPLSCLTPRKFSIRMTGGTSKQNANMKRN